MNLKKKLIELLDRVEQGEYSPIIFDTALKYGHYSESEKGLATEIFYGVIRKKILLEYYLEQLTQKPIKKSFLRWNLMIAFYQLAFMESKSSRVVWEAAEIAKKKYGTVMGKFTNALLRQFIEKKEILTQSIQKDLATWYSYPEWIFLEVEKLFPHEKERVLSYYKQIPVMSYRVNQLKSSQKEFEAYLQENQFKVQYQVETVYYLKNRNILRSEWLQNSMIVVQDAASYLAAKLLNPLPGELVLDACAAPGGKTAVLAEVMNNQGHIDACEVHGARCDTLKQLLLKYGVKNTQVHHLNAKECGTLGKMYDKILLDVPCSGLGVVRKKPEILYNRSKEDIHQLTQEQYEILSSTAKHLKVGGELLYSTCTFLKEENSDVVEKFLKESDNFEVISMNEIIGISRIDSIGGYSTAQENEFLDGFYYIKLKRKK